MSIMKGLPVAFLFFIVLKVCYAHTISSPATTVTTQADTQNDLEENLLHGKPCQAEYSAKLLVLIKYCPKIAPLNNYTELMNLIVINENGLSLIHAIRNIDDISVNLDTSYIDVCNEMSQSNFTSNVPASEILSHDQLCEMKRYEDIDVPEDEDEISRIAFFRKGCRILSTVYQIASANTSDTAVLSKEQLKAFDEVGGRRCSHFAYCRGVTPTVAKCKFLNETVVPNEQANQLGITVELYEKLVIVRKLYTDKTNSGRLAQAKRSCEAINGIEGDGVNLALDEHILKLSTENLNKFTDLWDKYKTAPNSEKIGSIGDICDFLNGVKFE